MRTDIRGLREFYGTRLGKTVRAVLAREVLKRWHSMRDDVVLGVGYATPVLRVLRRGVGKHGNVIAAMPRAQGGMYWPTRGDNRTVLVHKTALPFASNTMHRALLLHALEFAEDPKAVLRELCRVLTPGGRAIICVPHRRSIWSGAQGTPFGYGTPYSLHQLRHVVEDTGLTIMHCEMLLKTPPVQWKWMAKIARVAEIAGITFPWMGGVVLMEVEKQIYAGVRETKRKQAHATVWIPAAEAQPNTSTQHYSTKKAG